MSDYIGYEVRVYPNGDKEWYLNGELHRVDGPALEWADGSKAWYLNGERHREDGPAFECFSGYNSWWLNSKSYTESDYNTEMAKRNDTCNGKIVTIEGKQYELTEIKQ